ncbi:MAG: TauD/TfdA family dioxygenase [Gammaproteobacteria bacterium]|nr:TauD/TfdA family dioxygenase [Gammaproteobacteria bacterium]
MLKKNRFIEQKDEFPFLITAIENKNNKSDLIGFIQKNRDELFSQLYETGAILFRDFSIYDDCDFREVVRSMTPELGNYVGGDSPRDKLLDGVYTSTNYPNDVHISLHNEKSFSNNYPNLVYFFCEVEPVIGGETPILDGRKIYNMLDREIIHNFSEKKLKYVMNLTDGPGIGKSWQESFELTDKNKLEHLLENLGVNFCWKDNGMLRVEETVSPVITHPVTGEKAFFSQADQWHPSNLEPEVLEVLNDVIPEDDYYHHCYYGDDSELETRYLEEIRRLVKQERVTFKWRKSDFLILDNLLTMHGRFPFEGERRILVSMA